MKKIEKLIRLRLAEQAKKAILEPGVDCPSDIELSQFISDELSKTNRNIIEKHVSGCFLCLDKVVSAHDGEKRLIKRRLKKPPKHLTWKAKNVTRVKNDLIQGKIDLAISRKDAIPRTNRALETEKAVVKWLPKKLRKNRWLIASITAFMLSFAFPPLFLQFLFAAGILGGKWIFDSENARTLVMIYNAWKKGGEKEVGEMLDTLKDRLPSKK